MSFLRFEELGAELEWNKGPYLDSGETLESLFVWPLKEGAKS